jgi:hypothetical protein
VERFRFSNGMSQGIVIHGLHGPGIIVWRVKIPEIGTFDSPHAVLLLLLLLLLFVVSMNK